MARPAKDRSKIHVNISNDTLAGLDVYLMDPTKGRTRYGALTEIANTLFAAFLRDLQNHENPMAMLKAYGVDLEKDIK